MLLRQCNLAMFKTFCGKPAQKSVNTRMRWYCCKGSAHNNWSHNSHSSLILLGNDKSKKFNYTTFTRLREACAGWAWLTQIADCNICIRLGSFSYDYDYFGTYTVLPLVGLYQWTLNLEPHSQVRDRVANVKVNHNTLNNLHQAHEELTNA